MVLPFTSTHKTNPKKKMPTLHKRIYTAIYTPSVTYNHLLIIK